MDVYATYTAYPQSGIEQIKASTGTPAAVAECSAGKLWDVLHFVLTGKGSDDADAANPLSKAMIGNILRQDEEAGEHTGWIDDTETAEVAQALFQRGITPIIAGSAAETPLAEQIRTFCPQAIDLTGKTSLIELAGVLDRAEQVIGNDTGPMHLAAAMDRPVIALFSQDSDPRLTAPLTLTPGRTTILDVPDLALLPASRIEALLLA